MDKVVATYKRWTKSEMEYLKEVYGSITTREIGEVLDRSPKSVQLKGRKMGLSYDKIQNFNTSYFNNIITEHQAYWLGFIMADGCVSQNKEHRTSELAIQLQAKDVAHLEKLNYYMDGDITPKTYTVIGNFPDKKYSGKEYKSCNIRFYSKELVEDLKTLGVHPNKSNLTMSIPKIKQSLIHHFIRGYFDGDGSIGVPKKDERYGYRIGLTGNCPIFLKEIQELFANNQIVSHINADRDTYKLEIRSRESVKNYLDFAYKDCTVSLDRKHSLYLQLKELLSD